MADKVIFFSLTRRGKLIYYYMFTFHSYGFYWFANDHKLIRLTWAAVKMQTCTLVVWVRRLDSVAKPLPQMVQWKGRFLARSTWASWFLRCCCRLDNWMNARPHSARWQRYGLSPASPQRITIEKQTTSDHRESIVKHNNKYYHQTQ